MHDSTSGSLFDDPVSVSQVELDPSAPLAERMRPMTADELVGQQQLLGEGRLLRRLIDRAELASLVLWGPPGVGKTTLARILARASSARFVELTATASGVRQLRETADAAARLRAATGQRTVLFIDEIHRFHKGQQDSLLPWVESGALVLIGATTENPSFEVVAPLLSRCRVVRLETLSADDLYELLRRTLATPPPRGLDVGDAVIAVSSELLEQLATAADGDARAALNTLELAVRFAHADSSPAGPVEVSESAVLEALQRPHLRYGREEHFDQISALQKSVRSSDVDAALYWLARMIEAGGDPKYVARRLIRMASEDIGLADPRALEQAIAGLRAYETIGLPEGALALAQVTVYLAMAPKSDAVYKAWGRVTREVDTSGSLPVPMQLRNAVTPLMKQQGYGSGYRHAHDEADAMAAMECLPEPLVGREFYAPTDRGIEARIAERLREWRQLKAARTAVQASEPPSR